jgi:hypothetical protein
MALWIFPEPGSWFLFANPLGETDLARFLQTGDHEIGSETHDLQRCAESNAGTLVCGGEARGLAPEVRMDFSNGSD